MASAPQILHATPRRLARAEYHRIAELFRGERVELIHGMVVRMSPIGPPHANIVDRLTKILVVRLGDRARVRIQQPLLAWDESEPEPDVAVVPEQSYAGQHPDRAHLVIEVAETSLDYDRETKAPLYALSQVDEYWIVDVAGRRVEVYSDAKDGAYAQRRIATLVDTLAPRAFADVEIAVAALFS